MKLKIVLEESDEGGCTVYVPSLPGFIVIRQRGSHIRLHKRMGEKVVKITVPAHIPIKRSTLAHIIKD